MMSNPYELVQDAAEILEAIVDKFGDKWEEVLGEDISECITGWMEDAEYWDEEVDEEDGE